MDPAQPGTEKKLSMKVQDNTCGQLAPLGVLTRLLAQCCFVLYPKVLERQQNDRDVMESRAGPTTSPEAKRQP